MIEDLLVVVGTRGEVAVDVIEVDPHIEGDMVVEAIETGMIDVATFKMTGVLPRIAVRSVVMTAAVIVVVTAVHQGNVVAVTIMIIVVAAAVIGAQSEVVVVRDLIHETSNTGVVAMTVVMGEVAAVLAVVVAAIVIITTDEHRISAMTTEPNQRRHTRTIVGKIETTEGDAISKRNIRDDSQEVAFFFFLAAIHDK